MEVYTIYIDYPSGDMFAKSFTTFQGLLDCYQQHLEQINTNNENLYLTKEDKEIYTNELLFANTDTELDFYVRFEDNSAIYTTKGTLGD